MKFLTRNPIETLNPAAQRLFFDQGVRNSPSFYNDENTVAFNVLIHMY